MVQYLNTYTYKRHGKTQVMYWIKKIGLEMNQIVPRWKWLKYFIIKNKYGDHCEARHMLWEREREREFVSTTAAILWSLRGLTDPPATRNCWRSWRTDKALPQDLFYAPVRRFNSCRFAFIWNIHVLEALNC
jgi:hypothetical protein